MNAVLTANQFLFSARAGLRPSSLPAFSFDSLRERARRLSKRERFLATALAASLALAVASAGGGPALTGYLGVFGFSLFSKAVPIPFGTGDVMVAAAMVLNPPVVAILTAIGGALGKVTGYARGKIYPEVHQ